MAGNLEVDRDTDEHCSHSEQLQSHSPWYPSDENLKSLVYGNYPWYYGYRNKDTADHRLSCMKKEWLTEKDVLDIGCNIGHLTLSIARDFLPRIIVGMDIDKYLIRSAQKNTVRYLNEDGKFDSIYPISFLCKYGPFCEAAVSSRRDCEVKFPFNVTFIQGNYVLPVDELLMLQKPQFDTVLCLSLTKWIHLNWGDEGIKRTFRRIFAHLRPGGFLILEAQPINSYKKKKLPKCLRQNVPNLKFLPHEFNDYLLKEVGFDSCELIDTPAHTSTGFSRPIYLFRKKNDAGTEKTLPQHIFFDSDSSESSDLSELSNCEELSD